MQSGIGPDILQYPTTIEYTDSTWVQTLVNAMHHFKIAIHRTNPYTFPPQRKNDKTIMELATKLQTTNTNLRYINTCRQYLKVIHLSDITTPDGKFILPHIKQHSPIKSRYKWPRIETPMEIT